ncbi:MAG: DUF2520 domain-containing protein [Chitinophagaceae bacterium]
MRIVIIGSGNVANILGRKCREAGHAIVQVYGRNQQAVAALAAALEAPFTTTQEQLDSTADVYLLAVSDGAVAAVAGELKLYDKLLVHTAGSVSKEVLSAGSSRYGILYPLQSLRKEMERLPEIPLLIDGNTAESLQTIATFAGSLSAQVQQAGDEKRLHLHVAAVVVSNFTNHLYALADDYCKAEGLDFSLLYPLINEVAQRLYTASPQSVQTGPAIRKDTVTIEKHLALLQQYPALQKVYELLSDSIAGNKL